MKRISDLEAQHQNCARRDVHLQPVLAAVPFHGRSEVLATVIDPIMSTEPLFVTVQNDVILARNIDTDAIVTKGLVGVDWCQHSLLPKLTVENEQQARPFEDDDLVAFVLEGHERLQC